MMPKRVVAIIDDDPSMRVSLARLLRVKGFACEACSSAEEFLNHFSTSYAKCVIIDINLGDGLSGIELCKRLRAAGRHLNIILMTGVSTQQNEKKAVDAGCDTFLAKPFSRHALFDAIEKLAG